MPEFHKVAKVSDITEDSPRCVEVQGKRIALFSVDNRIYAIDDTCTHGAGPLSQGTQDGEEIECPVHEGRFNIKTGEACHPPAEEPVAVYNVRIAGDDVEVEV